jgi:hypothetical protein
MEEEDEEETEGTEEMDVRFQALNPGAFITGFNSHRPHLGRHGRIAVDGHS